jgi:hypothetical protein
VNGYDDERGTAMRRMMLALDALNCETALMEAAVALARALGAELDAVFVEDEDVYAVAELPITQEISLASAREREISGAHVATALRSLAREAEARFREATRRARLPGRFEVRRARRVDALREAFPHADLLLLLPGAPRALFRLRVEPAPVRRLYTLCADTPASLRALEVAGRLARREHREIQLVSAGNVPADRLKELERAGIRTHVHACEAASSVDELLAAVDDRPGNIVLIPADLPCAPADRAPLIETLLRLRCQVLIVN